MLSLHNTIIHHQTTNRNFIKNDLTSWSVMNSTHALQDFPQIQWHKPSAKLNGVSVDMHGLNLV